MAPYSSVLAWRIPGMGEPGRLPSMGSHRVEHDWCDLAAAAAEVRDLKQLALWSWRSKCPWILQSPKYEFCQHSLLQMDPTLVEAADKNSAWLTPWFQALETQSKNFCQSVPRILFYRNLKIIKDICFKPLSLWQFVRQNRRWIQSWKNQQWNKKSSPKFILNPQQSVNREIRGS